MWLVFNAILYYYTKKLVLNGKYENHELLISKIERLLDINFYFFTGRLIDPEIEALVRKIGENELSCTFYNKCSKDPRKVLHIASKFNEAGGHSRVVHNWINNDTERINHVLLTRQVIANKMTDIFRDKEIFFLNLNGSNIEKAQELVDFIEEGKYSLIVLHTGWSDTIPFLALSKLSGIKTLFYNHTDHCATFGTSFANAVVEIGPKSQHISRKYRNVEASFYLPMPLSTHLVETTRFISKKKRFGFLTIGSRYKFSPFNKHNFYLDIKRLFSHFNQFTIDIIGVKNDSIKGMDNVKTHEFVFNPQQNYAEASFFIESYPVGSGLALLDSLLMGCIPIFNKSAVTIYGEGSSWLFKENEVPKELVLENFSERMALFKKIADNKLNEDIYRKHFKNIISKHLNPSWIKVLNNIYRNIPLSMPSKDRKSKYLISFGVAKFCVVNNFSLYIDCWKEMIKDHSGIEYRVFNLIYKFIKYYSGKPSKLN